MINSRNLVIKLYKNPLFKRYLATKDSTPKVIKYTETINLPKTKFPQRLSPAKRIEVEKKINEERLASVYSWQREHLQSEFVLHDGPPYANGELHMGHAVNKILKDVTLKYHVVNQRKVHYKPGWDCHGLPIELKAMSSSAHKKLSPLEIREKARKFARETLEKQKSEFSTWGITADWTNIYRTFDASYIQNQLQIFGELYRKKLVYRDMKPVFWSPSSGTALAEAELEYDPNFASPSLTFRLKLVNLPKSLGSYTKNNVYALIWTTTPWTLPANQAVSYNPEFSYSLVELSDKEGHYIVATSLIKELGIDIKTVLKEFSGSELVESTYEHPIDRSILPFLPGKHVQSTKGTGLVHTAPAHGPDDFLLSLEQKIPVKCLVDDSGCYTNDAPEFLRTKEVLKDGNDLVIEHIDADIITLGTIQHSYPIDWRTKKPVIIRASNQWFINTDRIKSAAMTEAAKVEIYPKVTSDVNAQNLMTQLQKRPYWCISRQRSWGTPIPVVYDKRSGTPIVDDSFIEHLCSILRKEKSADFWWTKSIVECVPNELLSKWNVSLDDIEMGKDILDIWFDSGISWSYALDGQKVADLYLEGIDQFTGWFQSSLMTSIAVRNQLPYKSLFVHGFAVDEKGHKMSKSLGNIIVPKDIIAKYGCDAIRWWVAAHATQQTSIPVGDAILQSSAECVQKIRATLKYLVGCLPAAAAAANGGESQENIAHKFNQLDVNALTILDKYFLNSLTEFDENVSKLYETYQYNRVTASILHYVTNDLSAQYLHLIKDRLYCGTIEQHQQLQLVLTAAFAVLNKALWPILPFIVEECWSYYDTQPFYQQNITIPSAWKNLEPAEFINECLEHRQQIHQIIDANTWTFDVSINCRMEAFRRLSFMHPTCEEPLTDSELCEFLQVSSVTLIPSENFQNQQSIRVRTIRGALCARCRRFAVDIETTLCQRCITVLAEKEQHQQRLTGTI